LEIGLNALKMSPEEDGLTFICIECLGEQCISPSGGVMRSSTTAIRPSAGLILPQTTNICPRKKGSE